MSNLKERQFDNIRAHHMLVALDACSAGFALPTFLSKSVKEKELEKFRTLAIIRADMSQPARNILVAGTGEQRALWENGGIFTTALIAGLKGDADLNGDNIIQFDELALSVQNRVVNKAAETGIRQTPGHAQANKYGSGNILFLRHQKP
jgi:hypothetical protein